MKYLFVSVIISCLYTIVYASYGDGSPFYQKCIERCSLLNCTKEGNYLKDVYGYTTYFQKVFFWNCEDDCKYKCMWKTVDAFEKRNWRVPQFHGKWPFLCIFGLQEPASVVFSVFNLYVNFVGFKRFRSSIKKNAPFYRLWFCFFLVCMNGWLWSAIFHSRDLPITEYMDYSCAFSMVLMTCFCMAMRLLVNYSNIFKIIVSASFGSFFLNHLYYLSQKSIDYGYNMKVNIFVGTVNSLGWLVWCFRNRRRQRYLWKCAMFFILADLTMVLEVFDFPPILWTFDSHSLWHFTTALITPLFYGFIIDDCTFLQNEMITKKHP